MEPQHFHDSAPAQGLRHGQPFAQTQWTMVMAASVDGGSASSEALEGLCRAYWPPIFSQIRMKGHDLHQAEDLTQEFFSRLLCGGGFSGVTPDKGRFRTYLLAALRHFLINEWKRETTLKRGGGVRIVDLDALDPPARDACEPRSGENPDLAFDRQWAFAVISKVRDRLRREYEGAGQLDRHELLKAHLMDGGDAGTCLETADALGISEAAAKSAIHRIRRRFAELLRAEISRTVAGPDEVEDEIRHLLAALRHF